MRVLVLGPHSPIVDTLRSAGDEVDQTDAAVTVRDVQDLGFAVSYGYRHIVAPEIIEAMRWRIVNLHISLLPWNRGADPNFWSFFDDTPKGVTIHHMDEGLDTGPIIAQREVTFAGAETLASSYAQLCGEVEQLFAETWPSIRAGTAVSRAQGPGGSYHGLADRGALAALPEGWDTPTQQIEEMGRKHRDQEPAR